MLQYIIALYKNKINVSKVSNLVLTLYMKHIAMSSFSAGVFVTGGDIGIGTILGSAVFNVLFVLGLCGIVSTTVSRIKRKRRIVLAKTY